MARTTRYQLARQLAAQAPFPLMKLPPEIRSILFSPLLPAQKHRLRRRYTGIGGNTPTATIFALLHINRQLREEMMSYLLFKMPKFILFIQEAYTFPLQQIVRNLQLSRIELTREYMFELENKQIACVPTDNVYSEIVEFRNHWVEHNIQSLELILSMADDEEYVYRDSATAEQIVDNFLLGKFKQVAVRYSLNNLAYNEMDKFERMFDNVSRILEYGLVQVE
jgi:hypothetical protein